MTSAHRLLTALFVWIVFAWSITMVYGLTLTLTLPSTTFVGVSAFLAGAALLATRLISHSSES